MRILVPVEGTPECEISIPLAQQLASELDAEICLVRVVVWIDALSGLKFDPDILRMMDDAARYLAEVESRFELPADRTRRLVSWSDNAAKEIVTIAENEDIDLIIMATHCKGWLQRLAQGSVYRDVVRSQVCPVLCAPLPHAQASRRHRAMAAKRALTSSLGGRNR